MITFTEKNGVVTLEAHINGLTPGIHAIHVHQKSRLFFGGRKINRRALETQPLLLHGAWEVKLVFTAETLATLMLMKRDTA